MWIKMKFFVMVLATLLVASVPVVVAQNLERDNQESEDQDYGHRSGDRPRIDRFLDAELWTNHGDNSFYIGDNIVLKFRVNRDAFVAIYSVDTRGRVRMLFPSDRGGDNYVKGGITYRIPDGGDNYDLEVSGPEGTEYLQLVASQERIPLPDWFANGIRSDASDRDEYMDGLNSEYFVRYDGQRFAYDRIRISVDDWEPDYFRPVYHPLYPNWSVCGNMYFDYPWGASIYVDGIYWGCAPMYIPSILIGWHTVTVYDPIGYCWEDDIHVDRHRTVVLDRNVIVTRPAVVSRFKEVRVAGYRDPVNNGYPHFNDIITKKVVVTGAPRKNGALGTRERLAELSKDFVAPQKRYARDVAPVVRTDRGYEVSGSTGRDDESRIDRASRIERRGAEEAVTPQPRPERSGDNGIDNSRRQVYDRRDTQESGKAEVNTRRVEPQPRQDKPEYYQKKSDRNENQRSGERQAIEKPRSSESQPPVPPAPVEKRRSSDEGKSKAPEVKGRQSDGKAQPQEAPAKSTGESRGRVRGK